MKKGNGSDRIGSSLTSVECQALELAEHCGALCAFIEFRDGTKEPLPKNQFTLVFSYHGK